MTIDCISIALGHFGSKSARRLIGPHTSKMHNMTPHVHSHITSIFVSHPKFLGTKRHKVKKKKIIIYFLIPLEGISEHIPMILYMILYIEYLFLSRINGSSFTLSLCKYIFIFTIVKRISLTFIPFFLCTST